VQGPLGHAPLSEVVPDELVRVEVRGVAREEVELEPAALRLDELGDEIRAVGRMPIDHKEDRVPTPPEEGLEEGSEGAGVQPPREHWIRDVALSV